LLAAFYSLLINSPANLTFSPQFSLKLLGALTNHRQFLVMITKL